jgi:hypothetical protein
MQAYFEGGFLDKRVSYGRSRSEGKEKEPGEWTSEDWVEEYLSDNI